MAHDLATKIPLIETYGPVMQGEGVLIGRPTWFVRLGACDYLCKFCDSMHAVDPAKIEERKEVMSASEIASRVLLEMGDIPMVTVSGGNPALWDMMDFVSEMHSAGRTVAVETQGTHWKTWLRVCDYLTISPKGPGMIEDWERGLERFEAFMRNTISFSLDTYDSLSVKVPVFDDADLDFCDKVYDVLMSEPRYARVPLYISVGNPAVDVDGKTGVALSITRQLLFNRYEELFKLVVARHPKLLECPILPQLHVLQYGNELRR